jgi:hypothetical protein
MKKPCIFFVIVVSVIIGALFAIHSSEAQTKRAAVADFTAIERMERLVAELDASGQTNTITKVRSPRVLASDSYAEYPSVCNTTLSM